MRTKKIISLLLSTAFLNLTTNLTNCFGMTPSNDDYSIVDDYSYSVTVVDLPGYTNCPMCGATRSDKASITGANCFANTCKGCGSCTAMKIPCKRKLSGRKPNDDGACAYCGCRRFMKNGSSCGKKQCQCANCRKSQRRTNIQDKSLQTWKAGFCTECEDHDGFVSSNLIAGSIDNITGKRISKCDKVKQILSNPSGFTYYCYKCKKERHVILTGEELETVLETYDRCTYESV